MDGCQKMTNNNETAAAAIARRGHQSNRTGMPKSARPAAPTPSIAITANVVAIVLLADPLSPSLVNSNEPIPERTPQSTARQASGSLENTGWPVTKT